MRGPILFLVAGLLLAGCGPGSGQLDRATSESSWPAPLSQSTPAATPDEAGVELSLAEKDVTLAPLPIRAGVAFTITATIHNTSPLRAENVPLLIYISDTQEQLGYSPFLTIVTATVPATNTATVQVPVAWNLAGGEHRLWVRVNSVPAAWAARTTVLPEARLADNAVLLTVPVQPFDAYSSDLCAGRVDLGLQASDVWAEPSLRHVRVRVHNLGNQAAYNLPVIVTAGRVSGMAYTPAVPPCGGTAEVVVAMDGDLAPGEKIRVQVNPDGWPEGLAEDDFENNQVSTTAGTAEGTPALPAAITVDYDFGLTAADVDLSQPGILALTVHNLGTRDAASLPIRIEGKGRRKLADSVPLVEGGGLGVVAVQLGALWSPASELTITLNPADAAGAYPETARDNNVLVVTIPPQ